MRKFILATEEHDLTDPLKKGFVFLGGTCDNSTWRNELIKLLTVQFFNPIVENWTSEMAEIENIARENADVVLYVLTPMQKGFYVPVEMAYSCFNRMNKKTVVTFLNDDGDITFDEHQVASNKAIRNLLSTNPFVEFFTTLEDTAAFLNTFLSEKENG